MVVEIKDKGQLDILVGRSDINNFEFAYLRRTLILRFVDLKLKRQSLIY